MRKITRWGLSQPYPDRDNLRIFVQRIETAGLHYRKNAFLKFAKYKEPYLEFEREPENPHDANAIRVIGKSNGLFETESYFLGYVPAELSKQIVESGFYGRVFPCISGITISDGGDFVHLYFDLLGPKEEKKVFHGE